MHKGSCGELLIERSVGHVKEMLALGVPVVSGPNYRDDGYCTFFFRDPDGNIVHFAKWANDRGMFK